MNTRIIVQIPIQLVCFLYMCSLKRRGQTDETTVERLLRLLQEYVQEEKKEVVFSKFTNFKWHIMTETLLCTRKDNYSSPLILFFSFSCVHQGWI